MSKQSLLIAKNSLQEEIDELIKEYEQRLLNDIGSLSKQTAFYRQRIREVVINKKYTHNASAELYKIAKKIDVLFAMQTQLDNAISEKDRN